MHSFLLLLVVLDFLERSICVKVHILAGLKNFLFEFRLRFSDVFSQIIAQNSMWLRPLDSVIQNLSADIWNQCFPKSISSIPDRSIEFLHLSVVKLQNCVLHGLEDLDFSKRLSVTKVNNPVFAAFLLDLKKLFIVYYSTA
ncbi:hypothetical protein GEMRC1_006853 [Eukaryota sp. GEM-RC1]